MSTEIPVYAFDQDGTSPENLVSEQQSIQSNDIFDYFYIIPRAAPFFAGSVKLKLFPGGRELIEGQDYNFGHHFMAASHTIGLPIYGSISFYDHSLTGIVNIEYQTLGGIWTLDADTILEILANEVRNPRITSWDTIVELPETFPVINHSFDVDDFVGMSEVETALEGIKEAIEQSGQGGIQGHIDDHNNPHETTKAHVGLGLVDNYPTAALAEATTGTANNRFMTPLRTRQLVETVALGALTTHIEDKNNPHEVTKTQVGLGSVQNYAIASQAEAEQASSNARYMTPLRTREAIEIVIGSSLSDHLVDTENPHQVNKGQVGLGNVLNYPLATQLQAQVGTANDAYMTPSLTKEAIKSLVSDDFDAHSINFDNPHQVTKAQVGLGDVDNFPTATEAEARDATATDRYVTPLNVRHAINELVGDISGGHASDHSNPHEVTKVQVGLGDVENYAVASETEAREGSVNDKYMTPLQTFNAIEALIGDNLTNHIADVNNPHGVTAEQIGALTQLDFDTALADKLDAGAASVDTQAIFGRNEAETEAWINTLTAGDTVLFGGRSFEAAAIEILTGKAADSDLFDGKSYDEVVDDISVLVNKSSIQYDIPRSPKLDKDGELINAPYYWVKFGEIHPDNDGYYADTTLLLTGGRNPFGSGDLGSYATAILSISGELTSPPDGDEIRIYVRNAELRYLNNPQWDFNLGYVETPNGENSVLELWIQFRGERNRITITDLTGQSFTPVDVIIPEDYDSVSTLTPEDMVSIASIGDGTDAVEQVQDDLDTFKALSNNPHGVTKAQVGLSDVSNYGDADQATAVAGTADDKFMTPLRTKEAIDATAEFILTEVSDTLDDIIASFA